MDYLTITPEGELYIMPNKIGYLDKVDDCECHGSLYLIYTTFRTPYDQPLIIGQVRGEIGSDRLIAQVSEQLYTWFFGPTVRAAFAQLG